MIEQTKREVRSKELALKLYDTWVRERQKRPMIEIPKDKAGLKRLGLKNLVKQHVEPRRGHLRQLRAVAKAMTTADKVALLVMLELPVLETSALMHRLSIQLTENPKATYFSQVNQDWNCG